MDIKPGPLLNIRPWRAVYVVAVIVVATFWLGWPGLVVTLAVSLDTIHKELKSK